MKYGEVDFHFNVTLMGFLFENSDQLNALAFRSGVACQHQGLVPQEMGQGRFSQTSTLTANGVAEGTKKRGEWAGL